ncbi:MAG: hydrolase [Massilibacillus sp.]|jgi:putative nucleotidyltransferase with HDIG domain|nr:hydrolase [Massilibacillus sp.]
MKQRFLELLLSVVRRGIPKLPNYIENETDFFTAPASSQYHGAYAGGLVEHSLAVYENLVKVCSTFNIEVDNDSLIICGLLHDLCKANFYTVDFRNKKNEFGVWEKVPFYKIDDQLPFGHGEKSVMIIQKFIQLKDEEIAAIRWHMGSYDDAAKSYGGGQSLSAAMGKWKLVLALQMADMAACYFDNK